MNSYIEDGMPDPNTQKCQYCSGKMIYRGGGAYCCEACGEEYLTDFGKIKRYLEVNGPRTVLEIAKNTGVSRRAIGELINDGRIELRGEPGGSNFCISCGTSIRVGQYCRVCAKKFESGRRGRDNVISSLANELSKMRKE